MNSTLSKYLNASIEKNNNANTNESLILASIIASSCLTWAITPMLETTFMKNISAGIGGLLGGIGNLFGFGAKTLGLGGKSADDIKELLSKDPDDLTGREKDLLKKAAKDKKLQKEFSNNDLKKLQNIIGSTQEEPKEETLEETPEGITESLLALGTAANKNEENTDKKAENESLINLILASTYDENGETIPVEQREAKLKELVGEENWDNFKKDMENRQKSTNTDELKESLEKAQKELKPEDAKKMLEDQKTIAKAAHEKIKKEKEEHKKIDDEIQKLKDDPNADKNKIEELQKKKEELIKSSTVGKASSKTANAIIERNKKDEEPKKDEETDEDGNIIKDEEIEDPKTGKKMKVKTYTGPRGGKFYYPEGKPKKPENKVYVENYINLKNYLKESLYNENNLSYNEIVNESAAIASLAVESSSVTCKILALIFIKKIVRSAKKYIKLSFKIFNDLKMYDKLKTLNNNNDVLMFIKSVVEDSSITKLNDPKDIAIVTAIILAIWYITKWNKQKTEKYIKSIDNELYMEVKPELISY